jgi:site-specific DNA-methyltransferase (cytosine-N4-specific)
MPIAELIADLKAKENIEAYWDFRKNDQRAHVHSLIKYPAVMVPNMQGEIFDLVLKHDMDIQNVLDPFMGSGTILVEGLTRQLDVIGIDINPLSYLTVQSKMQKYAIRSLREKASQLLMRIDAVKNRKFQNHEFDGITKWYQPHIIQELSKIRFCILQETDVKYRRFFWVTFAEIAKQADNARTSTFKLHIKLADTIQETVYDCFENFKSKLLSNVTAMLEFKKLRKDKTVRLYCGDSRSILNDKKSFPQNSVDLVITSPPYGDNATTITYGQYSVLPLRWIPLSDIHETIAPEFVANLSKIGRESLGGINYSLDLLAQNGVFDTSNELKNFVDKLIADNKKEKARKVASFVFDFSEVIKGLSPLVKPGKLLVFTVGNRHVNKEELPLHLILKELAHSYGMEMRYDFRRNIIKNKNYVDTSVQGFKTINKETILILQKC